MNIYKVLDLSTAHAPNGDCLASSENWVAAEGPYQTFMWVPPANEEDVTDWLKPVFALAREHDCTYINFDKDGAACNGLPKYDWK